MRSIFFEQLDKDNEIVHILAVESRLGWDLMEAYFLGFAKP